MAGTRPAFSADALSFPPTSFTILNPDTGIAIGRGRYRVENAGDGATLHGENNYYDDQAASSPARSSQQRPPRYRNDRS